MFYHIAGKFVHKDEGFAVIDCGGVGYRLTISQNTADALGYPDGEPAPAKPRKEGYVRVIRADK